MPAALLLFIPGARSTDSRPGFQKRNSQIEGDSRARVQKSVVADLHEAGREDVLEEAANELECGKAHDLGGCGLGVGITKTLIALADLDDAGVRDRGAEDGRGEITNATGAGAYGLGVNVPVLLPELLVDL